MLATAQTTEFQIVDRRAGTLQAPWSFASALHPITPQHFFEEYWGQRPLLIRRANRDFYRDLISLTELEQYLSMDELFTRHSVSAVSRRGGRPEPPPSSLTDLYERLLRGDSLRMRRLECLMHPSSPAVSLFRDMEASLQHPRDSLSCYVAPPEAVGLGPHHDETEIFTLQISGTKRWKLYHRVDSDRPGILQPHELGEPEHDFVLEPGDLFYLPRGVVHDVSSDTPSFSMTLVFAPVQWKAVLEHLVRKLSATAPFVQSMPAGVLLNGQRPGSFRREFEERLALLREAVDELSLDDCVDELAASHVGRMTMPPAGQLENVFAIDSIDEDAVVEKRPGLICSLTRREGQCVLVLPGGYTLELSATAAKAVEYVLAASGPFRVADIPGVLSGTARIALARKLVGYGLIRRSVS